MQFYSFHHKDKACLVKLQAENKLPQLIQPAPTRWGTLLQCLTSLKANEEVLHQIVNAREFIDGSAAQKVKRQEVKDIICNVSFPNNLTKSIAILTPIQQGIVKFQSDKIALSEVYRHFAVTMPQMYRSIDCLLGNELLYLLRLVESRLDFMYGEALGLSYILDHNYLAEGMCALHRQDAEDMLYKSGSLHMVATENNVEDRRRLNEGIFNEWVNWFEDTLTIKGNPSQHINLITAKKYWTTRGFGYPALRDLAIRVFGMVASSAASERGFSAMNFIHSNLRNCLSEEKVKKLVYMKTNAPQVLGGPGCQFWGMEEEEEVGEEHEEDDMED